MASFLDVCRFTPTLGGTTDWTVSSAVTGYQTPASAGALNGAIYRYRAESSDLSQWEVGYGAYTVSGTVLARTTVLFSSTGSKVSFSAAPQVAIVALAEDMSTSPGHIFGLTLSNFSTGSTAFNIAAGECTDSTGISVMRLAASQSKVTSAWATGGGGSGALDTGTIASGTWYHVFLIMRPDTGVVDVLISLSATAPTLPTNYTLFRRIGSMLTDGSSHWTMFSQRDDEFLLAVSNLSSSSVTSSTTAQTAILGVPSGIVVNALFKAFYHDPSNATTQLLFSSLSETDQSAAGNYLDLITNGIGTFTAGAFSKRTNGSGQIRVRSSSNTGIYSIATYGWIDTRGRLS